MGQLTDEHDRSTGKSTVGQQLNECSQATDTLCWIVRELNKVLTFNNYLFLINLTNQKWDKPLSILSISQIVLKNNKKTWREKRVSSAPRMSSTWFFVCRSADAEKTCNSEVGSKIAYCIEATLKNKKSVIFAMRC